MSKKELEVLRDSYQYWLVDSLKNQKKAATYLQQALKDYLKYRDLSAFLYCVRNVVEAQGGVRQLAYRTQLNPANLYNMLNRGGNPKLQTFSLILTALGLELGIKPLYLE